MRQFYLTFLASILLSCSDNSHPTTDANSDTISEKSMADTCDCTQILVDSSGILAFNNEPYTGICLSYYEGTQMKYIEKNIFKGKLHGSVSYFDKSGELLFQEFYDNGILKRSASDAAGMTCDCSELQSKEMQGVSVYRLDDVPYTGKCERQYENSTQLYMESNYKNGLLDGYTIYYNRDGSTILMEKYEQGIQVSAVH